MASAIKYAPWHFSSHCFPGIPWSAVRVDMSDSIGFYWQRQSTPRSTGLPLPGDYYLSDLAKISSWQCSGLKVSQVFLLSVLLCFLRVQVLFFLPHFFSTDIFPTNFYVLWIFKSSQNFTHQRPNKDLLVGAYSQEGERKHQRAKCRGGVSSLQEADFPSSVTLDLHKSLQLPLSGDTGMTPPISSRWVLLTTTNFLPRGQQKKVRSQLWLGSQSWFPTSITGMNMQRTTVSPWLSCLSLVQLKEIVNRGQQNVNKYNKRSHQKP